MADQGATFTALADPTRRAIFERVAAKPASVSELAHGLPVSRPAVSQHLRVLKDARLVRDTPVGTKRIYEIDPAGLAEIRRYFEQFWTTSLSAFRAAAEQTKPQEGKR
jgi:DNA-binding transcriptional ArsR family regulator